MKALRTLIAVCLLTAFSGIAGEPSDADKKWGAAVEQMISAGATTISTPSESRAKLATELATKLGRDSKTEKTEKGYKVVVSAGKSQSASVAKAGE